MKVPPEALPTLAEHVGDKLFDDCQEAIAVLVFVVIPDKADGHPVSSTVIRARGVCQHNVGRWISEVGDDIANGPPLDSNVPHHKH